MVWRILLTFVATVITAMTLVLISALCHVAGEGSRAEEEELESQEPD